MTGIQTRYGVKEQVQANTDVARAVEEIRLFGFAIVPGGYRDPELDALAAGFDQVHASALATHGGREVLAAIDEHNTIRAMLAHDSRFLTLARNPNVLAICAELLGGYYLLNQQNGIVNPALRGNL